MRALYASRFSTQVSRAALASISTTRMWCATEAKPEADAKADAKAEKKKETTEEVVTLEAYKKLEKEINDMKEKLEETKKQALYCAAEAENARRIGREDVDKAKLYGITSFGKDMLEVADTLEKGLEAFGNITEAELSANKQLNSIHTGVKLSLKVLAKNMNRHGIEKMNTKAGTKFDPNFHDALVSTPATAEHPAEHISGVLKDGYTIKNRILRAAQVSVSTE